MNFTLVTLAQNADKTSWVASVKIDRKSPGDNVDVKDLTIEAAAAKVAEGEKSGAINITCETGPRPGALRPILEVVYAAGSYIGFEFNMRNDFFMLPPELRAEWNSQETVNLFIRVLETNCDLEVFQYGETPDLNWPILLTLWDAVGKAPKLLEHGLPAVLEGTVDRETHHRFLVEKTRAETRLDHLVLEIGTYFDKNRVATTHDDETLASCLDKELAAALRAVPAPPMTKLSVCCGPAISITHEAKCDHQAKCGMDKSSCILCPALFANEKRRLGNEEIRDPVVAFAPTLLNHGVGESILTHIVSYLYPPQLEHECTQIKCGRLDVSRINVLRLIRGVYTSMAKIRRSRVGPAAEAGRAAILADLAEDRIHRVRQDALAELAAAIAEEGGAAPTGGAGPTAAEIAALVERAEKRARDAPGVKAEEDRAERLARLAIAAKPDEARIAARRVRAVGLEADVSDLAEAQEAEVKLLAEMRKDKEERVQQREEEERAQKRSKTAEVAAPATGAVSSGL